MKLTFFLIILLSTNILLAQGNDSCCNILSDNNKNISTLNIAYSSVGITAAAFLSFLVDNSIRSEVLSQTINRKSVVMEIGHNYGDITYNLGLAGILYASNYITRNSKYGSAGKSLLESLLVGGLASVSIKYIFGRSRPYKEDGNIKFNWFETNNIFNSFPSGHVMTAFTTSTVLSNYFDNLYLSIALYSLAGLTAYQRIATDNHWFSDVLLGSGIGIIVGSYFSKLNISSYSESNSINLIPFVSKNNSGVYIFVQI